MTRPNATIAATNVTFPKGNGGFRLLTPGNPETEKGRGAGFWTFILHLAPAMRFGFPVCPMSTQSCRMASLNTPGRGELVAAVYRLAVDMVEAGIRNTMQNARLRK